MHTRNSELRLVSPVSQVTKTFTNPRARVKTKTFDKCTDPRGA
jgi:hypothetical protein